MPKFKKTIRKVVSEADKQIDLAKFSVKQRLNLVGPVRICPYYGFGTSEQVYLKGRMMEEGETHQPDEDDGVLKNAWVMLERFVSDEIPHARLRATFRGETCETATDHEGYFDLWFDKFQPPSPDDNWHDVHLELLDEIRPDQEPVRTTGKVLIPHPKSEFGVISDVDDTIIVTNANNPLKKARTLFFNNASTRTPFPGIGALYRALERGQDHSFLNPLFFLSSSSWHLYDLLVEFCKLHHIPRGPFLLQDMGIEKDKFIKEDHFTHKLNNIHRLLRTYPGLPFILIGDSGQKDPEIYQKVAQDFPDRIKAIYIRDVTTPERDREVKAIARQVKAAGVEMLLADTTEAVARHALQHRFITRESFEEIQREMQREQHEQ